MWGLSGTLSRRCQGLRPCLKSVSDPEDSSPVLTWILGYFWSLPRGVSPRLEWGHARALSPRAVAAVSRFPCVDQGMCGFPSRLSHEALPRDYPTRLSHVPPWCESILGLKVDAVQGKLRHLGDSGNGGTTLEFLSAFRWRAPPPEMRRKCREFFPEHAGKGSLLSS